MPKISRRTVMSAIGTLPLALSARADPNEPQALGSPVPLRAGTTSAEAEPLGDFAWQGHQWWKRTWAGAPHYNGTWSADNVLPGTDGSVILRMSNAGSEPVAAEMISTRAGWGYGRYQCGIQMNLDTVGPALVYGGMFTYDSAQAPTAGHNEIDSGEISSWGVPGMTPRLSAGYWVQGPQKLTSHDLELPTGLAHFVFRMVWTPTAIYYRTWAGKWGASTLIASSALTGTAVPVPAEERVHLNLWVTDANAADEASTPAHEIRLTEFTFTPA